MNKFKDDIKLKVVDHIDDSVKSLVFDGLRSYNDGFALRNQIDFSVIAVINDQIVAASIGESKYEWLIIKFFYVKTEFRNNKIGTRIINKIAEVAKIRNCKGIHLDTFEFQAKEFYVKQGFEVFGEINDHPSGYKRFFMKMSL